MGVELMPETSFPEISAGGESGGEGVVIRFRVLERLNLGEHSEAIGVAV